MAKDLMFLGILGTAGLLTVLCFWLENRLRLARQGQQQSREEREEYRLRLAVLEQHLAREKTIPGGTGAVSEAKASGRLRIFPGALDQAGLRLRLKEGQPRSAGVVERYRLVANMVRRGLSAEDIGAILQISDSESEQLMKLTEVGRQAA